jgi:arylsulfatase A-like enzyme
MYLKLTTIYCVLAASSVCGANDRPSVLIINIDDLNDWNGVLQGHPQAITPNIERLAKRGLTFTRAICASPVCFPSRTAVFSGIHPARSGAISNFNWGRRWRFYVGDAVTLPKHLESLGWPTFGAGKNLHGDNRSEFRHYFARPPEPHVISGTGYVRGPLGWGVADACYEEMPDHRVVSWGIRQIQSTTGPMFLSLGIYKPHVKWILPQASFDRYPLDRFQEPVTQRGDLDDLAPRLQLLAHNEAKFGVGYHKELRNADQTRRWARAYLAAVTFADEQLGRLLDAWDASEHSARGIIVLWSDHGFMLGEKEGWGKFKPWCDSIHSNLIFAGPGIPQGMTCDKAVSLLDIYPTLIAQLGVHAPPKQTLDGNDLSPLLTDAATPWDRPPVMSHEEDGISYDVVMNNRYRMTRLVTVETELYDLLEDPHELTNLASEPEYTATIERLSEHVTFRTPIIDESGCVEAEGVPCQTSADFGRRGNFCYPRKNTDASGGAYLCVELTQGRDSYVDLIPDVRRPGTYEFGVVFGMATHEGDLAVSFADVATDARQATAEYPMTQLGQKQIALTKTRAFQTRNLGSVQVDTPGLKLLRIKLQSSQAMVLRIDRLRISVD